eukprot:gene31275-53551_t
MGAQPAHKFEGQAAGLAVILQNVTGKAWPALVLSAGAVISVFSVTLVTIYGQTRILYAISKDGLMPKTFQTVNPKTHSPVSNTLIVCVVVGVVVGAVVSTTVVAGGTVVATVVVVSLPAGGTGLRTGSVVGVTVMGGNDDVGSRATVFCGPGSTGPEPPVAMTMPASVRGSPAIQVPTPMPAATTAARYGHVDRMPAKYQRMPQVKPRSVVGLPLSRVSRRGSRRVRTRSRSDSVAV